MYTLTVEWRSSRHFLSVENMCIHTVPKFSATPRARNFSYCVWRKSAWVYLNVYMYNKYIAGCTLTYTHTHTHVISVGILQWILPCTVCTHCIVYLVSVLYTLIQLDATTMRMRDLLPIFARLPYTYNKIHSKRDPINVWQKSIHLIEKVKIEDN